MTSLKDFFPLRGVHKQQKNFIKENIQRVKACNKCSTKKKESSSVGSVKQCDRNPYSKVPGIKYSVNERQPIIKCNVKIIERGKPTNFQKVPNCNYLSLSANENDRVKKDQECQTDIMYDDFDNSQIKTSCTLCGHMIQKRNIGLQAAVDNDNPVVSDVNNCTLSEVIYNKNENVEDSKVLLQHEGKKEHKENIFKKQDNSSKPIMNHKIGEVPRYLKERNAKSEQEKKQIKERERIEELLGLNDPDCPPKHKLMPNDERIDRLNKLEKEFEAEIRKLNTIPVSSDSYRVRQRKIQIEKELNRIEEAINALKKPKVFIKMDDEAFIA